MKRISLSFVFLIIAGYMFAADSVQTLQNGMKVSPKNGAAKTIEIDVVNSRIIRVQASPENVIPNVSSLCVLSGITTKTPFKVTGNAQFAQLSTDELTVKVVLRHIWGKLSMLRKYYLSSKKFKTSSPIHLALDAFNSVNMSFNSPVTPR